MTTAIAIPEADPSKPEPLVAYSRMSDERRVLLRHLCGTGASGTNGALSDAEMSMLVEVGLRSGLDPFQKQIYGIVLGGKFTILTGIGGFRAVARRNGLAGLDAPKFAWADEKKTVPHACEITAYRWGPPAVDGTRQKESYTARCLFNEFCGTTPIWRQKPSHMLAKCTEACVLRMAFTETLGGLYIREEFPEATGRVTRVMPDARDPRALLAPTFDAEVEPEDPTDKDAP